MEKNTLTNDVRSVASGVRLRVLIPLPVMSDRRLAAALQAGDRKTLFDLLEPILKEIRGRNRITQFYYILPDRTMLRVQVPDTHGDRIDRFVLQEAQYTGRPFWGNEQGPFGSFTLRVACPWYENGEVIGYLERGIGFEDIMRSIKTFLDVDVFVAIDKKYFDRMKWWCCAISPPPPASGGGGSFGSFRPDQAAADQNGDRPGFDRRKPRQMHLPGQRRTA